MPSKEDQIRELIGNYSPEGFEKVLKGACAPAAFVGARGEVFRGRDGAEVRVLGVVKDLPGENGYPAPLLVADVPLETVLTERSSRVRQFKLAREVLEACAERPPMELDGVVAQGIFAFHDREGHFRISLVTAVPENGRFNWSKARRQSFYVTPEPEANATFVQRMGMDWSTLKGIKEAFSVEKLTKEFYDQLFKWYDRACEDERVEYPNGLETDADNREDKNRKHLLRLITRLMFVWFLKQKGLVPEALFDEAALGRILKDFKPTDRRQHQYYRAILQNLFFATLNSEIADRGFADDPKARARDGKAETKDHGIKTKYRYADAFAIPREEVLALFRPIPFLNGGLFECLDQEGEDGRVRYYDGFSLQERHRDLKTLTWAHVPNDLFFDPDYGILPLLKRYNFTVEENSPGDEDVALDPELLGKVFENLLGAYNPETQEIARNSTGSFYTPREIVNYMVDEALVAHLAGRTGVAEGTVRALVADGVRPEDGALCRRLAEAIETTKILDPACGSGAFPMGALLKMAELLRILKKLPEDANLYDLKLQLIENCIFGSDIQEIAVQIAKLRVFISLVCEQKPDRDKPNYGINTLPNLETKYVAANSLVALKKRPKAFTKKDQSGDLFFETGPIQATKDALWKVRHLHFLAKTRAEKEELRARDIELRSQLAAAAEALGYSEESTRLMASWDPYNQNVHAEFFDPEWMFNVRDGFDIVIGNPPYGALFSNEEKKYFRTVFPELGFKIDSYVVFLLRSRQFLKDGGICSYIIPNPFLDNRFLAKTRELLLGDGVLELNDLTDKVFSAACVHSMILSFGNFRKNDDEYSIRVDINQELYGEKVSMPASFFRKQEWFAFNIRLYAIAGLLEKLKKHSVRLETVLDIRQAIKTGNDGKYISDRKRAKNYKPILRGKDVFRYAIIDPGLFVDYGKYLACPRSASIFEQPKILIREAGERITASLDTGNYYIMSSLYNAILIDKRFDLRYLLGLINSRLFQFLMWKIALEKTKGAFTKAKIFHYYELPVREVAQNKEQAPIIALVDRILSQKSRDPSADTTSLEREIDELVYGLYGLTAEERAIVEGVTGPAAGGAAGERGAGEGSARSIQHPLPPSTGGKKKVRALKIEEEF